MLSISFISSQYILLFFRSSINRILLLSDSSGIPTASFRWIYPIQLAFLQRIAFCMWLDYSRLRHISRIRYKVLRLDLYLPAKGCYQVSTHQNSTGRCNYVVNYFDSSYQEYRYTPPPTTTMTSSQFYKKSPFFRQGLFSLLQ